MKKILKPTALVFLSLLLGLYGWAQENSTFSNENQNGYLIEFNKELLTPPVVYDYHFSTPGSDEEILPHITVSESIEAHTNVHIKSGDECVFKVYDYINLSPGFKVESGASLWAYTEEPLITPDSSLSEENINLRKDQTIDPDILITQQDYFNAFPNPFKNVINVELNLSEEKDVSIMLFNTLGQVMTTILPQQKLQKGKHEFNFQVPQFLPGLYYCHARIGQQQFHTPLTRAK